MALSASNKKVVVGGVCGCWCLWMFMAAICLVAGAYNSQNLSFVDCFYGGVSTQYTDGNIKTATMSRSCNSYVSLISCKDYYDNLFNNQSLANGAGDPALSGQWLGNEQLRDLYMEECEAPKRVNMWLSGWTCFLMLVTSAVSVVAAIRSFNKAGFLVSSLTVITLLLLLMCYQTRPSVSASHYDCKGMANQVYGDASCGNAAFDAAAFHEAITAPVTLELRPWKGVSTMKLAAQTTGPKGKTNFGGQLPSCVPTGLSGYDSLAWYYQAPGDICTSDQAGGNRDVIVDSFNHWFNVFSAGVGMGLLMMFCSLAHALWSAYDVLIVRFGDEDEEYAEDKGHEYTDIEG